MNRVLCCACVLVACEATGFEPEYFVDTLRVIAVQGDLPLAAPGESVHFTTMWADPNGGGRPISWAWGTCVNPGSSQIPVCATSLSSLALGIDSFTAKVPDGALDGTPVGELGVIFAACAGTITLARNPANGAPVTCRDAQGAIVGREGFVWGGTRVTIVTGLRNQNPGIDQVFVDGNPWANNDVVALDPNVTHALTYTATDGSAETWDIGTGPITEALVGWFYVTDGALVAGYTSPDSSGAFDMTYTPPATHTRPVRLWLVLRDDRGGLAYTDRQFSWK